MHHLFFTMGILFLSASTFAAPGHYAAEVACINRLYVASINNVQNKNGKTDFEIQKESTQIQLMEYFRNWNEPDGMAETEERLKRKPVSFSVDEIVETQKLIQLYNDRANGNHKAIDDYIQQKIDQKISLMGVNYSDPKLIYIFTPEGESFRVTSPLRNSTYQFRFSFSDNGKIQNFNVRYDDEGLPGIKTQEIDSANPQAPIQPEPEISAGTDSWIRQIIEFQLNDGIKETFQPDYIRRYNANLPITFVENASYSRGNILNHGDLTEYEKDSFIKVIQDCRARISNVAIQASLDQALVKIAEYEKLAR